MLISRGDILLFIERPGNEFDEITMPDVPF